jgi:hypothetical protein
LKPIDVTLVLNVFQRCDPYLNRDNQITSELLAPCKQVWQRYGTIATEQLAAYAEELKEYYKS